LGAAAAPPESPSSPGSRSIPDTGSVAQLEENVGAADPTLADAEFAALGAAA